jgi:hypothetical protein
LHFAKAIAICRQYSQSVGTVPMSRIVISLQAQQAKYTLPLAQSTSIVPLRSALAQSAHSAHVIGCPF